MVTPYITKRTDFVPLEHLVPIVPTVRVTYVPYRGAGPALNDLLGGHIDFMFNPDVGYHHAKAGRLQLIATTAAKRFASLVPVLRLDRKP